MAKEQLDKKKRKNCSFCADKVEAIDYKDAQKLRKYLKKSRDETVTAQNIVIC